MPDEPRNSRPARALVTILPCTDLDAAQAFFARLGFAMTGGVPEYRILEDAAGAEIHLQPAVEGWLVAGRNPFGVYLRTPDVDRLADVFAGEIIEAAQRATHKPWGMYEFALNGPDDLLVRVGWPSRSMRDDDRSP